MAPTVTLLPVSLRAGQQWRLRSEERLTYCKNEGCAGRLMLSKDLRQTSYIGSENWQATVTAAAAEQQARTLDRLG